MNAPASLAEVGREAEPALYPRRVLAGCETALILFASGFWGRQDGFWVADAGLRATCIDVDADRLDEMAALYPTDWYFVEADAYAWAPTASGRWDVVSADCPTGHFDRCAEMLPVFCRLAKRAVVVGAGPDRDAIVAPDGWEMTEFLWRSNYVRGGVHWAVLEAV